MRLGRLVAGAVTLGMVASLSAAAMAGRQGGRPVVGRDPGAGRSATKPAAAPVSPSLRSALDKVARAAEAQGVPGAVMSVSGPGLGTWEDVFGTADRAGSPLGIDDHFRIGSITKTFTATVILQLVDEGRLHLTDRLARWEPRVANAGRITIRMLLDMTSGIWDEGGEGSLLNKYVALDPTRIWTPQEIVNLAIKQGAAYPPGVVYYSDTNYALLGIIAQDVTRHSLGDLIRQQILDPLGLRQTSFPTTSLRLPSPATSGFLPTPKGYQPGPASSPSALFGAGNMVSTLHDLQIWSRAFGTGSLLRPSTRRLRAQFRAFPGAFGPLADAGVPALPGTETQGTAVSRGPTLLYGLGIIDAGGMLGHNGVLAPPGYTADMWYLPSRHASVVVLLNSFDFCSGGTVSDATASALAQVSFGDGLQLASIPINTSCNPAGT